MGKASTPSYVLTLKLNTNSTDERELHNRFFGAFLMKNKLIKHARKRIRGLRQDKRYRALISEYFALKERLKAEGEKKDIKKALKSVTAKLSALQKEYGLSEYQFHEWIAVQKRKLPGMDINTAQKIATSVWRAVETVLFKKGKTIHFQKFDSLLSLEGKTNSSGIIYRNGRMKWMGLSIQVQIRKNDRYAREALKDKVKYCRITRKPMGTKYHYYLQIVLEGTPPRKHEFLENGNVGLDQGVSTEAVVSENGCILTEVSDGRPDISERLAEIQRRMDRSLRALNPDNYNEDGTVKRGVSWKYSKRYRKDRMRCKTLQRKAADAARQSEERLANDILCNHGSDIYTEPMRYKALQKRSSAETQISEITGRCKSKKRFGRSISRHAPARFKDILSRKLGYIGKELNIVNMYSYKASQYNHTTGEYEKTAIDTRTKMIGTHLVQRDLYSAFLLMCAKTLDGPNKERCSLMFDQFIKNHNETIRELLSINENYPSCMGLKDFKHLAN